MSGLLPERERERETDRQRQKRRKEWTKRPGSPSFASSEAKFHPVNGPNRAISLKAATIPMIVLLKNANIVSDWTASL